MMLIHGDTLVVLRARIFGHLPAMRSFQFNSAPRRTTVAGGRRSQVVANA